MSSSNLAHMIGQMFIVGFDGKRLNDDDPIVRAIVDRQVGGVILFDYNFKTKTFDKNIESRAQVKALTQQLREAHQQSGDTLPLIISVDVEGGQVNRLKPEYGFPEFAAPRDVGAMTDDEIEAQVTSLSEMLRELGFNFDYVPSLDVNVYPENPIIGKLGRSFSSEPDRVIECARHYGDIFNRHHLLWCYKHFPGHGSSHGDSHHGFVDVTETWQAEELAPYQALLSSEPACPAVMIAHVTHLELDGEGHPASLSKTMIEQLLRLELGFEGVAIADDMQMKAITDQYGLHESLRKAINAGCDMLIFGNQLADDWQDPKALIDLVLRDIETGHITVERIEQAYDRIRKMKEGFLC